VRYLRLKFLADIQAGQSPSSDDVSDSGDLPFLQGCAEFGDRFPHPTKYCSNPPKRASRGDWLISVRAPVGELNIADQDYGIGHGLAAVSASNIDNRFLGYVLSSAVCALGSVATGSTYHAVSAPQIANLKIPYPDADGQKAIADFLDGETARIDQLTQKKQRLIALLRARYGTAASEAVSGRTRHVGSMCDSGIDWIGDIPAHWTVPRVGWLQKRITYGFTNPMPTADEGPFLLTANDINDGRILYESARRTTEDAFKNGES
jgi:type I restriction enzyme, S subunit